MQLLDFTPALCWQALGFETHVPECVAEGFPF